VRDHARVRIRAAYDELIVAWIAASRRERGSNLTSLVGQISCAISTQARHARALNDARSPAPKNEIRERIQG
jgi:hypothetical protein